ncbi:MAG: TonB-dependent receptor [Terricaulis sp.]|nr:TonB-dependent receptor [Terricaulis sp.]
MLAAATAMFTAGGVTVAAAQEADEGDAIVVTGTRIARRDAVAESPILTVGQEEMTNSGFVTVEQYLNTLPQVTPGISSQSNNPSSNGRAFVDLRGLGSGRNLVLIDGRRPMGSLSSGTVDVNTIPAALTERVEIITGGAASTYGADAVSGVVNFILRDNFEGFAIDGQYRLTERGDGEEWGADVTFGGNFADGRGNAVFNASYFSREAMYKGARDFAAQASSLTGTFPGGTWTTGTNTPSEAAIDAIFAGGACSPLANPSLPFDAVTNPVITNGGSGGFGFNPDGSLFCTGIAGNPFDAVGYTGPTNHIASAFYPDTFSYNFEPDNILVLPMERWNMFTRISLDVNEYFRPYVQATYTNYNALQELAPTPGGGFVLPYYQNNDPVAGVINPLLAANPQLLALANSRANPTGALTFNKRFNQVGGRTGYNTHDVWQVLMGTEGDLSETWTYDVYASFGRSVQNEVQGGNILVAPFNAFLANPTTAFSGACASWNPMGLDSVLPANCASNFVLNAKNLTTIEQTVVEGSVTGELFQLPAGAVQAAFGAGYREIEFDFLPDGGLVPGAVVGFNAQLPIQGTVDWFDVFGEIYVPILANLPGVESLSVTAGYRVTDQSQSGSAESWKITGDWTVTDWLRFRAGVQTATRSPSIAELFSPQVPNFPAITGSDPCNTSGGNATAQTGSYHPEFGRNGANGAQVQALCAAQAAVAGGAAFSQPFGQAEAIAGGNPNLSPETSDSYTVGFVLNSPFQTGGFLDTLFLSVDYWSIEVEDAIGAFSAVTIIQRCFNRDGANPTYDNNNAWCQLFQRDASDGRIDELLQLQDNRNYIETSGVDIAAGLGFDLGGAGSLNFNLVSTWVEQYRSGTTVSAQDPIYEYIGTIGSGTGSATPEWRHVLTGTYAVDALSLTAVARYTDSMYHNNLVTGGTGTGVDSIWYFDLRGTFDLTSNLTLRAGVNNVADTEPELYSPNIQANTDPSTYDVLGRRFFVGFNLRM